MLALCAGVICSFTLFGYVQEAVTKTAWGESGDKFKSPTFLILLQAVGNCFLAKVILQTRCEGLPTTFRPFGDV